MENPPPEIPTYISELDASLTHYDHISWISNVSGRLFFHLTNGYNYRKDRIVGDILHYNEKVNGHRIFFLSLLVDLRDLKEKGKSKYTRVVILAKTLTADLGKVLTGNVFFIDDEENIGLYKNEDEVQFTKNAENIIKEDNFDHSLLQDLVLNYIQNEEQKPNLFIEKVEFTLRETGIIFLKKDNDESSNTIVDPDIKSAFHLLKFTFHKDRFHHISAEEIIRIVPSNTNKEEVANKLVTGVKRHIAEMRKDEATPVSLQNLKGVIGYTQTLIRVLNKDQFYTDDSKVSVEKELLDQVDKSLDKELESKPFRPATIYQFIAEIQSIGVLSLAILAPLLIISSKDFTKSEPFVNLVFIPTYICAFLVLILAIFGFNMIYSGSMKATYIGRILDFSLKKLNDIKQYSNPNISSKLNIFSKYLVPGLINIEMFIRRLNKHIKTLLFIVLSAIIYFFFFSFINEKFFEEKSFSQCFPFKSIQTDKVLKKKDENTTLIIKKNIAPLIVELKGIKENIILARENQDQYNKITKNLELNSTLHTIIKEVKKLNHTYEKNIINRDKRANDKNNTSNWYQHIEGKIKNFFIASEVLITT